MKNHNFILLILLFSVAISASTLFAIKDGYALTNPANQTVAITTQIFPITILTNELMPLLDTSAIGNLTALTVTANLPCDTSNVPTLKIIAGILGNTTNVIDSSSDYTNNKGPRDTCVFTDKITNVTAKGIPAMNRVFLKNTGSTPVHIPEGVMVTLTGIFGKPASPTPPTPPACPNSADFCDDYTTNAGWTQVGGGVTVNNGVAGKVSAIGAETPDRVYKPLGLTLSATLWYADFEFKRTTGTGDNVRPVVLSAGTEHPVTASQDMVAVYEDTNLNLAYKDGAGVHTAQGWIEIQQNVVYYVRFERTSATNIKLSVFTDPERTTLVALSGTNPLNLAIPATITGLTHLQHSTGSNAGVAHGFEVDNIKIYNNRTP